jgi:P pilus assembly chaperone PapD
MMIPRLRAAGLAAGALAAALALTALPVGVPPFAVTASAQGQRAPEIVIQNRTRATLQNLFLVGVSETSWGEDRLGADTVAVGGRYTVTLESGQCRYDMRAVYANGGEETRFDINLCRNREIVLTPQSQARGSATPPRRSDVAFYLVRNRTGQTIPSLNVFGVDDHASEAEDVLGASVLENGQTFTGRVQRSSDCRYNVGAGETPELQRANVNLCTVREIVFGGDAPASGQARAQPSGPQTTTQLTVTNNGPVTINVINTRAVGSGGGWGVDHLGADVLPAGRNHTFNVQRAASQCAFDILVIYDGGQEEVRPNQDICQMTAFAFTGPQHAAGGGQPSGPQTTTQLTVTNNGRVTIQVINTRPSGGSAGWGVDRLGTEVLPAGRSHSFDVPRAVSQCIFDIRVSYDGGGEEVRANQDICQTTAFEFTGPQRTAGRGQRKGAPPANGRPGPVQVSQVTIVNGGQLPIDSVAISSSRVQEWGDNRLEPRQTIPPGGRVTLPIERDGQCNFDILVGFQGGREERRMRQNICQPRDFTFTGSPVRNVDGGGPADGRPFAFVNDGRTEIMEIYATPVSDTHWGDDLLGADTLPRRARLELRLPQNECRYDIRIVYRGGANEERRDQNLCDQQQMAIGRRGPAGALVSTGTGFYVTGTGHILTNQHVIDGCSAVAYVRPDGRRVPLRVLAEDEGNDLALLHEAEATTPAMSFRRSASAVRAGERVVLVGYPVRNQLGGVNVTEGLVSALRGPRGDQSKFQYTAPTQPGNSGGPVIDEYGLVVGVVVAQFDKLPGDRTAQNINFGITLDTTRRFLEANGVTVTEDAPNDVRRPVDILERSMPSVLPLDCLG